MPLQQPTSTSSPKVTVSVAKICSVILVFLAMLAAASMALQVSWLWLLLPLLFLAYLDLSSSGPISLGALLAPQTSLFYGGLVAVALAFQFGGLGQAKPAARPVVIANAMTPPNSSGYAKMSSGPRPGSSGWPNSFSVTPGSSLPRPVAPPKSIRQTEAPGSAPGQISAPKLSSAQAPTKSPQISPTPVAMPTVSAPLPSPQPVAVTPAGPNSVTPPVPTTLASPAPGKSARPSGSSPYSAPAVPPK